MADDFWEQVRARVLKDAQVKWKAQNITASSHPVFYSGVERLAAKAGIKPPIVLYAKEIPIGPLWMRKLPNGGAAPGAHLVVFNESMLKSCNATLHEVMPPTLETVFAHEFSHLKDGFTHALSGRLVAIALPLVSMAGLYLYEKAKARTARKKEDTDKTYGARLHGSLNAVADEEIKKGHSTQHKFMDDYELNPNWKEHVMHSARYAMAAAIGLAAGLTFARYHSLAAEYRADKFAVEITKKPEAMKSMFTKTQEEWKNARPKPQTLGEHIKDAYSYVISKSIHAHPTQAKRLSYIDKVAAEARLRGDSMIG
jgi:Zn-dependent protease with chaperone function